MSFLQLRSRPLPRSIGSTAATAPVVTTQAASSVIDTSAVGNGTITSDGGSTITQRGFVWSTSPNPTTSDNIVIDGSTATGVYSDTMTPLVASTLYHYRAYAINAIGTSYGADTTFTTTSGVSTITFITYRPAWRS